MCSAGSRRRVFLSVCERLIEGDTDSVFRSPNDVAWQPQSVFRHNQCEIFGYPDYIEYLESCPGSREIADHAFDLVATVINLRGLGYTVAGRNSSFDHNRPFRLEGSKKSL